MSDCTFIPYPAEVEEREEWLRKHQGDCYDCRHHISCCGVCDKTGLPLTYPIVQCPGHDSRFSQK